MYVFDTLINSPLFMSGAFILNMFGGRMIFQDMQPYIQGQILLKYVFIFCLFLISTKDINISLILTVVYIIFMQLIKDLNPVKKEDESKEEKTKYIDSCIELLNNVKQTL